MATLLASPTAWSLGFGDVRAQVVLGQPLNLAVPVSLGEGESLGAECGTAEVTAGDVKLQAGLVRVRVTQGRDANEAVIRIATTVPIEEPVLQVQVGAGCPARTTRLLTLLADPPMLAPVVATLSNESPSPAPSRVGVPAVALAPAAAPTSALPPPRRAVRPSAGVRAARRTEPATAAGGAAAPIPRAEAASGAAPGPSPRKSATDRPRLRLEAGSVTAKAAPPALQMAEAQAAAASAAAAAADLRMKEMEVELARVRADAKAQTEALLQLRQQIALDQAQRARQGAWIPYLLGGVGVLALLAAWLGWRVWQLQSAPRREAWWDRAPGAEAAPPPREDDSVFASSQASSRVSGMGSLHGGLAEPVVTEHGSLDSIVSPPTVAAPMAVTIPPAPPPLAEDESSRAMSVDEQIDLEQQADFFIALGHDDAAIDLLMAHLRSTGGGTPLPFLKLLEIHRRRGDREAYERTRVRFNQRFNSVAPDWSADPKSGRNLEDYPLTIGRLQHAWPNLLDAMAELEALLFRRGSGAELFELPAYQEVLFLYQLARDMHQAEQPDSVDSAVDVLLPISEAPAAPIVEGTIQLRPEFNGGQAVSLDLDLSSQPAKLPDPPPGEGPWGAAEKDRRNR